MITAICMCSLNQRLVKPAAETCWSGETCCSLGVKFDDNHVAESTGVAQGCRGGSDADAEVGFINL